MVAVAFSQRLRILLVATSDGTRRDANKRAGGSGDSGICSSLSESFACPDEHGNTASYRRSAIAYYTPANRHTGTYSYT